MGKRSMSEFWSFRTDCIRQDLEVDLLGCNLSSVAGKKLDGYFKSTNDQQAKTRNVNRKSHDFIELIELNEWQQKV